VAVGFGIVTPTVGFGEPFRWPGELVADGEGLAFGVARGVGVGAGVGVGVAATGTGEMAERVADCGAKDAAELPGAEAWAADAADWAAADAAAELATADPAAAELTAAELPGFRSGGFVDVLQAASAEKTAIALTTWMRRAVRVRRAIPHAATAPGRRPKLIT
jgi:hypothetical protein